MKFAVSGQQVVAAGSPVAEHDRRRAWCSTPAGRPTRSFFTPDRLLVRATEVGAATKGANLDPGAQFIKTVQSTDYTTSAPPALQAQGLTLEQNEAPMGTMNLVNASVAFAQSPGPLSLEAAALETYFGGLHAGAQQPGGLVGRHGARRGHAAPARPGRSVTGHDAPLDVEIDSADGTPTQVVLRTTVTLSGGSAPGEHAMTVVLPVHGAVVTIGSWTFS